MKIDAAFLCDRVEEGLGGMINAIGINSLMRVRQLPHDLNLTLVCLTRVSKEEAGNHTIEFCFYDPSCEPIGEPIERDFHIPVPKRGLQDSISVSSFRLTVCIRKTGMHSLQIVIDNAPSLHGVTFAVLS